MLNRRTITITAAVLGVLLAASPAAAQGNGRGNAFGHRAAASVSPPAAPAGSNNIAAPEPGATAVRNFGSWLDDASIVGPGAGFMSFSVGYWRMPAFTEFDAPSFDVGIGLSRRVQAGVSVPVYHAGEPGGPVARGIGDLYLSSKIQLRDPSAATRRPVGLAVIPLVQIASAPAAGISRVSWALPLSLEVQRPGWRAYGSAGYFSRGSLFASAAAEIPVSNRAWITGTISQSRATAGAGATDALGLSRLRTDVSGGATAALSHAVSVFGAVGRTLSRQDPVRTRLSLTAGLSVNFAAWQP